MAQLGTTSVATSEEIVVIPQPFVAWSAVFAGAVLAAALAFVLLTFGTAIGLSATSPWPGAGLSATVIAALAVFWAVALQIGSLMAGGYVAGRMRPRWAEVPEHEIEFRDGLHGGLVWAVGILIGSALLWAAASGVARTGAEVSGRISASSIAPMDMTLDAMLRPSTQAAASGAARGAAAQPVTAETRAEFSRLLMSAVARGSLADQDRSYLAQTIAQRTGVSQQEAESRVNEAITASRQAADKARRAAVLTGFVTAASLIVSLAAAWWAAVHGGRHQDNSIPARFDLDSLRRRSP